MWNPAADIRRVYKFDSNIQQYYKTRKSIVKLARFSTNKKSGLFTVKSIGFDINKKLDSLTSTPSQDYYNSK